MAPGNAAAALATQLERHQLEHELWLRYGAGTAQQRWLYLRKKYVWHAVVGSAAVLKRALDLAGAGAGLLLLSPLLVSVALLIKLHDGGPVFYVAKRVGKWGREFPFPKFRSMVVDADARKTAIAAQNQHADQKTFKMKHDPRVTPIGRFIRRTSIDELPQLWCVLTGDMSLVGPRPPVPREVAAYTLSDRRRLNATPGITGLWQVSGRGDIAFPQMLELDVNYIESQSLLLDLKLLLRTVPAVLLGKGAY